MARKRKSNAKRKRKDKVLRRMRIETKSTTLRTVLAGLEEVATAGLGQIETLLPVGAAVVAGAAGLFAIFGGRGEKGPDGAPVDPCAEKGMQQRLAACMVSTGAGGISGATATSATGPGAIGGAAIGAGAGSLSCAAIAKECGAKETFKAARNLVIC